MKDVTTYNVLYVMAQKAPPVGGYVAAGVYHGTSDIPFTNSDGHKAKTGARVGWFSPDIKVGLKGLEKINLTTDVETGKNMLGGGGVRFYVYFNSSISLLIGPMWYTDRHLRPGGADHLWTTQLDVDIPLGK
jgi:hypothetical protein